MRKTILAFCLTMTAALGGAFAEEAAAAPDLASVIPAGSDMVILVESAPDLISKWSDGPLARMWNDPQVRTFLAPLREEMGIDQWEELTQEKTGFTLEEIKSTFTGQAALVFPSFSNLLDTIDAEEDPASTVMAELALLAVIGGNREIAEGLLSRDLEKTQEGAEEGVEYREATEEFEGETLHIRQRVTTEGIREEEGWAIVQGVAVMAQPKAMLQKMVAGLKRGGVEEPWSASEIHGKIRGRVPSTDILFFLDFARIPDLIARALAEAESADPDEEPPAPNPMGFTTEGFLKALRLETIQAVYMAGTSSPGKRTEIEVGVFASGNEGIMKALAYLPGPVALPDFIAPDALSAGAANFSFQTLWATLREILGEVSPPLMGLIDMQLQQMATNAGVDLEKNLIGNLGEYLVSAEFLPPPDQPGEQPSLERVERFGAIELKDRQSFEIGLDAVLAMFGQGGDQFEHREYLGTMIHSLKMPGGMDPNAPGMAVSYAITDRYFLLGMGSAGPVESALARMRTPGESVWKKVEVRSAMQALPPGASGISTYDVAMLANAIFQGMAKAQEMGSGEGEGVCDPEALPDIETLRRYFETAVGAVYRDENGLFSIFHIPHGAP